MMGFTRTSLMSVLREDLGYSVRRFIECSIALITELAARGFCGFKYPKISFKSRCAAVVTRSLSFGIWQTKLQFHLFWQNGFLPYP